MVTGGLAVLEKKQTFPHFLHLSASQWARWISTFIYCDFDYLYMCVPLWTTSQLSHWLSTANWTYQKEAAIKNTILMS